MNRLSIFFLITVLSINCFGQSINLAKQLKKNEFTVINRTIAEYENEGIELNALEESGLAILNGMNLKTGTINLEIKGENAPARVS